MKDTLSHAVMSAVSDYQPTATADELEGAPSQSADRPRLRLRFRSSDRHRPLTSVRCAPLHVLLLLSLLGAVLVGVLIVVGSSFVPSTTPAFALAADRSGLASDSPTIDSAAPASGAPRTIPPTNSVSSPTGHGALAAGGSAVGIAGVVPGAESSMATANGERDVRLRHSECEMVGHFLLHFDEAGSLPTGYAVLKQMHKLYCVGEAVGDIHDDPATMTMVEDDDPMRALPPLTQSECDYLRTIHSGLIYTQQPEYQQTGSGHHGYYYAVVHRLLAELCGQFLEHYQDRLYADGVPEDLVTNGWVAADPVEVHMSHMGRNDEDR